MTGPLRRSSSPGELLKRSERLLEQDVHPTVITRGFQLAVLEARRLLETEIGTQVKADDQGILVDCARTAMGSKGVAGSRDELALIAVKAVQKITEQRGGKTVSDVDQIKVEKRHGGTIHDTELIDGIVLDKERGHPRMPAEVSNAKIALLNSALEVKKTEIESKINIKNPSQIQSFLDEEDKTFRKMVESVKASGANVVICQKGIDDVVLHYLARDGIFALKQVKESDLQKLARATGGKIVTGIKELSASDLGQAAKVEERKVGDDDMTFVTGCSNPRSVSILIRGGTEHVTQEVERSLHDALKVVASVLEDGVVCPGGGATEIELAVKLRKWARDRRRTRAARGRGVRSVARGGAVGARRERRLRLDQHADRTAQRARRPLGQQERRRQPRGRQGGRHVEAPRHRARCASSARR